MNDIDRLELIKSIKNSIIKGEIVSKHNEFCLEKFILEEDSDAGIDIIDQMIIDINKWIASINNIKVCINNYLNKNLEDDLTPSHFEIKASLHPDFLQMNINQDIITIKNQYIKIKNSIKKSKNNQQEFINTYNYANSIQKILFVMKKKLLVYSSSIENYNKRGK